MTDDVRRRGEPGIGVSGKGRDARPTTRMAAVAPSTPSGLPRRPRRGRLGLGGLVGLIPALATLVLVGGAALALTGGVPWASDALPITTVPRLVERDLPEATSIATAHGLNVAVANTIVTADRPRGSVVAQDPQPERRVRKGGEVKVTISAGIRPPDVVGRPLNEARATLVRGGWTVGAVEVSAGAATPPDTVVGMRPGPDEPAMSRQQPIGLIVSGGNAGTAAPAPTVGNLAAGWGPGASATLRDGSTDRAGRFYVKAGSSEVSANPTVRLTFSRPLGSVPVSVLVQLAGTDDGLLVAAGVAKLVFAVDQQPGYVEFSFLHTPVAGRVYVFDYMIAGP